MFAEHTINLGLTNRSASPLSVTTDGLLRGRRTKLPVGEAIGGGDSKYLGGRKDARHRFHDGTSGDA